MIALAMLHDEHVFELLLRDLHSDDTDERANRGEIPRFEEISKTAAKAIERT